MSLIVIANPNIINPESISEYNQTLSNYSIP